MTAPLDPKAETRQRRRRVVILLFFLGLILSLVFAFRAVLAPFLVAMFVAYLLDPVIEWMAPRRLFGRFTLGRGASILVIYLLFVVGVWVGGAFAIPAVGRQLRQARDDLPAAQAAFEEKLQTLVDRVQTWWGEATAPKPNGGNEENGENGGGEENGNKKNGGEVVLDPAPAATRSRFHLKGGGVIEGLIIERGEAETVLRLGDQFHILQQDRIDHEELLEAGPPIDPKLYSRKLVGELVRNLDDILAFTIGFAVKIVRTFAQLVLILMVAAFLLIDRKAIVRFIQSVPPRRYQGASKHLMAYLDRGLAGVIRGQLMICAVNGVLTWIGLQFLGVRYPGLLGLIAGVFSLIPIFGTILSSVPIVLIAWATGSFYLGVLALAWILLIHFIEANFLNPKIMGTASKIHPVVVIFALIAGEHAYGIVGALLAVPAASIVQSCFKFYVIDRQHEVHYPGEEEEEPEAVVINV